MTPFEKTLHQMECEAYATLKAIPKWKEAAEKKQRMLDQVDAVADRIARG